MAETAEITETAPKTKRRMGPVGWIVLLIVLAGAAIGGRMFWAYLEMATSTRSPAASRAPSKPCASRITSP